MSRYWHTLKYLRPVQFYGRVWFKLLRPKPDLKSAPSLRVPSGGWVKPAGREPSTVGRGQFLFLGESGALAEIGWDGPQREKLWRYNQHYFDDLNAVHGAERVCWHQELLNDWVANNLPGVGTSWEPYPTSLRIVNWIKWSLSGNKLADACIQSLAVQTRWLSKRLEIHLLGNHLFANAKALVFAGLFFNGPEADTWLKTGLGILKREVPEQILPDGGHFERSTMYHALALEDMLDLCDVGCIFCDGLGEEGSIQLSEWRQVVPKMVEWLHVMCHQDGEIGFFNDAALGISPSVQELDAYAARLGFDSGLFSLNGSRAVESVDAEGRSSVSLLHMQDSGYIRVDAKDALMLLDVAAVGPDYLPGHAHADTLSMELSAFDQRVMVNSGTSCYGSSAERLRQRGTAAHNTVVVDGEDSSEVWGGFRVARRARPVDLVLDSGESLPFKVSCAHDGYRRLKGRVKHQRTWVMDRSEIVISDSLSGRYGYAEARFHLHPDVRLVVDDSGKSGMLVLQGGQAIRWSAHAESVRVDRTTYHPRFGSSLANECLVLILKDGRSQLRLDWSQRC